MFLHRRYARINATNRCIGRRNDAIFVYSKSPKLVIFRFKFTYFLKLWLGIRNKQFVRSFIYFYVTAVSKLRWADLGLEVAGRTRCYCIFIRRWVGYKITIGIIGWGEIFKLNQNQDGRAWIIIKTLHRAVPTLASAVLRCRSLHFSGSVNVLLWRRTHSRPAALQASRCRRLEDTLQS